MSQISNSIVEESLTKSSLKIDLEWPVIRLTVATTVANSINTRGECMTTRISRMVETSKKVRRIELMRTNQQRRITRRMVTSNKRIDGKTKGRASSSGTKMMNLTEVIITSSNSSSSRLRTKVDSKISMARIKTTNKEEITLKALTRVAIKIRWAAMSKTMVGIKTAITTTLQGSNSSIIMASMTHSSSTMEEATKRQ